MNLSKKIIAIVVTTSLFGIVNANAKEEEKIQHFSTSKNIINNEKIKNVTFEMVEKNLAKINFVIDEKDISRYKVIEDIKYKNYAVFKILNSYLPDEMTKNVVVKNFDTTVDYYEIYKENQNNYIKIYFKEKSDVKIEPNSNGFSLVVSKSRDEEKVNEKSKYMGSPVTINIEDVHIREALRILSEYSDFNLVTTDSVSGNITIKLDNVPFDHALDVILQSKGLDKRVTGNVIFVSTSDELSKMEEDRLAKINKLNGLSPLETTFIPIKYAKAEDLEKILKPTLSDRGDIMTDKRTNTLIIKDIDKNLVRVEETIKKLDIPVKQVLIESRIVIAKKSTSEELGVKLGGAFFDGKNYMGTDYKTVVEQFTNEEFKKDNSVTTINDKPMVNLGVPNPAGSIAFGIRTSTGLLDVELSAIEEKGNGEVIARPKIVTADKKTALIKSGRQIPYQQSSGTAGATTISFKDAVLMLEVTPQITPNGKIIMDLKINQDSVGELTAGGPSIDTTQIESQILVDNGETIVLGGIFQSEKIKNETSVPVLGDIPAIGKLFRNSVEEDQKVELLIFITPKLIDSSNY